MDHDKTINDLANEKNKLSTQIELYEEILELFDIDTLSNSKYNEFMKLYKRIGELK